MYFFIPAEIREILPQKELSIELILKENSIRENYEHFKEIFKTTVLLRNTGKIRKYAIENAISNDKQKELFYLEFGVYVSTSTNFFSKYVKKLYAFDSFDRIIDN